MRRSGVRFISPAPNTVRPRCYLNNSVGAFLFLDVPADVPKFSACFGFSRKCDTLPHAQLLDTEPRPGDSYLKHSFSWLLDLPVRVTYDDAARTVTLQADEFDSVLVAGFVIHSLAPAGVIAFTDETDEIRSPQAPWSLIYVLAGVSYRLKVVRQKEFSREGKIRVAARLVPL